MHTLLLAVLFLPLFACDGGDPDDSGALDSGTTEDTDTAELLPLLTVHGWHLAFGWDDAEGKTRTYTVDGTETASSLRLRLGTASYLGSTSPEDTYCDITWGIDGTTETAVTDATEAPLGFTLTLSAASVIADTCTERMGTAFDDTQITDSLLADIDGWSIDFALGGEIGEGVPQDVSGELPDRSHAFGGSIFNRYLPDTTGDGVDSDILVYGYALDESFSTAADKTHLVPAEAYTSDSLVSGLYEINAEYLWRFDPTY